MNPRIAYQTIWDRCQHTVEVYDALKYLQALAEMPSEKQWIPCSERLPENIDPVVVTWENIHPESYYKSIIGERFCGVGHYCNGKWFWYSKTCQDYLSDYGKCDWDEMDESIKVHAWMPLPEPYMRKEGEEE